MCLVLGVVSNHQSIGSVICVLSYLLEDAWEVYNMKDSDLLDMFVSFIKSLVYFPVLVKIICNLIGKALKVPDSAR